MVNNRKYNGRKVKCYYYDGKTNYSKNHESLEDQQKRIDDFGKWLSGQIDSDKIFNIKH